MSGESAAPAGAALEGVPRQARLALLALAAVAQAVPGLAILAAEDWYPPGLGSGAFAVLATVLGAGIVGLVFLARGRVLVLRARVVAGACGAALLLSLVLMAGYRATLDVRVVTYDFDDGQYRELVPFGTSRWVNAELLRRIRNANRPPPRSASAVRPSHLVNTLQEYGPTYVKRFYGGWHLATVGGLWVGYLTVLSLLVGAFGLASVRLGHELGGSPAQAGDAPSAQTPPVLASPEAPLPALAGEPAPTAPADLAWERRVAELEAELRSIRAQVEDGGAPHSGRNGRAREPLVVRAEIRASGWLLLGAAAMAVWISGRPAGRGGTRGSAPAGTDARND